MSQNSKKLPTKSAAVITIGTEITIGQISNGNAQWITSHLHEWGLDVSLHLSVPDDRAMMLASLEIASRYARFIFVTGGLGPTNDDITREIMSEWTERKLDFDEASWASIQERMRAANITIASINNRQCYFPRGAKILSNPMGTAPAFSMQHLDHYIWVLPGPPRENQSIWHHHVEKELQVLLGRNEEVVTIWQCLGESESMIAQCTEEAIGDRVVKIGYRAHEPFIEVKVWHPKHPDKDTTQLIQDIEASISRWILYQGQDDYAQILLRDIIDKGFTSLCIIDGGTFGYLQNRFAKHIAEHKEQLQFKLITTNQNQTLDPNDSAMDLVLTFSAIDENGFFTISAAGKGESQNRQLISPFAKLKSRQVRNQMAAAELALFYWRELF